MSPLRSILVMLAFALVWLLRPIVTIRFGTLFVSRLGHLAGNTECYLCERDSGMRPKRTIDIWCPIGKPANEQLLKMFKRVMWVSEFGAALASVGPRWKWWKERHTFSDAQWGRDIHNLMEKSPPHLAFTKAEEERGRRALAAMGMPPDAKWVCIVNRDSFFLRATEPWADYSYHDFRNSSIQNYRETAVALMDRGYWVIRMGSVVEEKMQLQAPHFIDYACLPVKSDFMDVYLGAKCAFTISNGCGFDGIPMIFRRPICFVNEAPFEYLSTWMPNSLAIWKHHYKIPKENLFNPEPAHRMTPAEIVASGAGLFHTSQQYKDAGITLVENTPAEILDVAVETAQRVEGMNATNQYWIAGDEKRQVEFWHQFPRSQSPHNGLPLHGIPRLRIGTRFLNAL